ncbi:TrfB-related DNA-binding protein [Variovorax ureilyticus]|uniref:TrfB-related DNA-binding protein n=1 Tax=Variovorax ureilyticus TaxID=1836198 RepID=A0ABU8VPH3_9BURK
MTTSVDAIQLERIARKRRFDPRTLEIARRLFLQGDRPKLLAAEYGLILQRIYAIRKAVLESTHDLPAGWNEVTLRGPAEAVEAAQRAFNKYVEKLQADGN